MRRLEGWEKNLERYLHDAAYKEFKWGSHDCVMFALDWFQELTGVDLAADVRGTYSNEVEAQTLLEQRGGLASAFDAALPIRDSGMEKRGDIALCDVNGNETIGIVAARGFIFFVLARGLCAKRIKPLRAWGVD